MQYWLLKTEPEEWSWKQQVKSGKKGDVFFIDTSNLHRGSPLIKGVKRCLWLYF